MLCSILSKNRGTVLLLVEYHGREYMWDVVRATIIVCAPTLNDHAEIYVIICCCSGNWLVCMI